MKSLSIVYPLACWLDLCTEDYVITLPFYVHLLGHTTRKMVLAQLNSPAQVHSRKIEVCWMLKF